MIWSVSGVKIQMQLLATGLGVVVKTHAFDVRAGPSMPAVGALASELLAMAMGPKFVVVRACFSANAYLVPITSDFRRAVFPLVLLAWFFVFRCGGCTLSCGHAASSPVVRDGDIKARESCCVQRDCAGTVGAALLRSVEGRTRGAEYPSRA